MKNWCKIAVAIVVISSGAGCFASAPPAATPTPSRDLPATVRAAVEAALGPTASGVQLTEAAPTATPRLAPTDTPKASAPDPTFSPIPDRDETAVPRQSVPPAVEQTATPEPTPTRVETERESKFWLPRRGTYDRGDGVFRYAQFTLESVSGSLGPSQKGNYGQFNLPSKGDLIPAHSLVSRPITGYLFMECSEPGDLVSVGAMWEGEIAKTEHGGLALGIQFDDKGWQYSWWGTASTPTTALHVPPDEAHEYVRQLANGDTFALDIVFDDGTLLEMRWNLPGQIVVPSNAASLCDFMRD